MIDPELAAKLDAIEAKADAAFRAADKARKYLLWTGVVSVVVFVLPLIALIFAVPFFLNNYLGGFKPYLNTAANGESSAPAAQNLPQTAQLLNQLGL